MLQLQQMKKQNGSMVVGIIIGVVIGLAAALAVAVYVTKVPVPFVNKGQSRTAEQDAAESRKNQNWDPNAPLYGKNPVRPAPAAPAAPAASGVVAPNALPAPGVFGTAPASGSAKATPTAAAASAAARQAARPGAAPSADPLGDLAAARSATPGVDPFLYFVQAGAFRTPEDAEAQRAKLSLMGMDARVTEREQAGRQVYRVRMGPFDKKDEADRNKEKLEAGGIETALVRVQR